MKRIFKGLLAALLVCCSIPVLAQQAQPIPTDPNVRIGKLENGLTYYIRHNNLPEGQADFYIAQKVGSILEEESQRGLAHFLEHMCFNGTQHFPNNRLREYLENIGVRNRLQHQQRAHPQSTRRYRLMLMDFARLE